jgi:hypothetical protein
LQLHGSKRPNPYSTVRAKLPKTLKSCSKKCHLSDIDEVGRFGNGVAACDGSTAFAACDGSTAFDGVEACDGRAAFDAWSVHLRHDKENVLRQLANDSSPQFRETSDLGPIL